MKEQEMQKFRFEDGTNVAVTISCVESCCEEPPCSKLSKVRPEIAAKILLIMICDVDCDIDLSVKSNNKHHFSSLIVEDRED